MRRKFPAFRSLARRAFCEKHPAHNQSHFLQRNQFVMPEQETIERAREDAREGKSPSTQAGEFVREEMEHIREGKHGARSPQQAIAIGLSKARRAGVKLPPPKRGSAKIKKQAARDLRKAKSRRKPSRRRSRAVRKALKRESRQSASRKALSRQARTAARRRSKASRSRAAKKAARTRKRNR
jgi:Family of unknown function (DUF6496)